MSTLNKLYSKNDIIDIPIPNVISYDELKTQKAINQASISADNIPAHKFIRYFTNSSGLHKFNIDESTIYPVAATFLSPKFKDKYLAQLESIVFTTTEAIDQDKLLSLLVLYSFINKGKTPIRITSGKLKLYLPQICDSLNTFFNKNQDVLYSIYTMFNSIHDTKKENHTTNDIIGITP